MIHQPNLRICQINMNNQYNLIKSFERLLNTSFDIICAQEPYSFKNIFSPKTIVIKNNDKFRCATFYKNQNLKILANFEKTNSYFNVADASLGSSSFTLVNCYFPPKTDNKTQLIECVQNELQHLMELFSNQPTLFVGDFNAKSSFWSSEDEEDNTNERGHWFLDKIISHEYSLLNDPSEGPTFESNIGFSYIDLSFASVAFFKIFDYKWNIAQSLRSDSDHHPIVINIMLKAQLQSSLKTIYLVSSLN